MIRKFFLFVALALGAGGALPVRAADKPVNLRLGTLAPRGTSYHKSLVALGEKWRQAANGTVRLTIFPDGSQGGEADMVGLMQTGNLDAGLLTANGLAEIEPAVTALQSLPMSFRTLAEVDYVGDKLRPMLGQRLAAKGYTVLFWTDSGWVRFFTKTAILRPDDMRPLKLFSLAGNVHEVDLWKSGGFHPIALESKGIPQGLLSDTISAVPMPPFYALVGQLDLQAKHMLELNWAPLVGAAVVRTKAWERIAPETRTVLLAAAADAGREVKATGRKENEDSVREMVKRGLQVTRVTPEAEGEWRSMIAGVSDQIRGKIVPADMYDEAQRLLKEFRAAPASGK